MKKLIILVLAIFASICTFSQKGPITLNVNQNTVSIVHKWYIYCESVFNTDVFVTGDSIKIYESWIDSQTDCLCTYDITTIVDSVKNGNYFICYFCISPHFPFDTVLCHTLQCIVNPICFGNITKTTLQSDCLNAIDKNDLQYEFYLSQNVPNPFISETSIEFFVKDNNGAILNVFNSFGQLLISKEFHQTGNIKYSMDDLSNIQGGIYYYKLYANGKVETRKMTCIK